MGQSRWDATVSFFRASVVLLESYLFAKEMRDWFILVCWLQNVAYVTNEFIGKMSWTGAAGITVRGVDCDLRWVTNAVIKDPKWLPQNNRTHLQLAMFVDITYVHMKRRFTDREQNFGIESGDF
jgi:hypothetical protein